MTRPLDRSRFVPPIIWVPTGAGYRAVDRAVDPTTWSAEVESDAPVVTQVDDGSMALDAPGQSASSSSSQPSIVAAMLEATQMADGMSVLEIGTGTGWTAALLAQRLGSANVTTVEVDSTVAAQARAALHRAGLDPLVVVGNGELGWPAHAPFDRVLATCAVTEVPWPWVDQTALHGLLVTPWGTSYHNGMLARLVRTDEHRATGFFLDLPLAFMRLRSQRDTPCPWDGDGPGRPEPSACALTSEQVYEMIAPPGAFAVGLVVPRCHKVVDEHDLVVRLHDPSSGSWARCTVSVGAREQVVLEHGPRSLWQEAMAARGWWIAEGRPGPDRFGLTVTAHAQEVWFDHPGRSPGG